MKKLSIAALVVAGLAVLMSGAALWRTRDISSKKSTTTAAAKPTATTAPALVSVPNATTKNAYTVGADLRKMKLKFKVVTSASVTIGKNRVMAQNPAPGTKVPVGTEIELTVSTGPP